MIKQFRHQDITWVDVTNPTKEELAQISRDYKIHSLVESEASSPSARSRVDLYDNYLYLILHFPECHSCVLPTKKTKLTKPELGNLQEIDFILSQDFLITIHYKNIPVLDEFSQIFETSFSKKSTDSKENCGLLFFQILLQIYRSLDDDLNLLTNTLKKAESNIFNGREKEMILVLSNINQDLLDFSWSLKGHDRILKSLTEYLEVLFPNKFKHHSRALFNTYWRIYGTISNLRDLFTELRTTNDSLLTTKTNEIMKILTIMAFTTFPLTVFTSTFGMNTINTPIIGQNYDFWIIVAIMLVAVASMFIFFRYKRWL